MKVRRGSIMAGLSLLSVGCSAITTFDGLMGDGEPTDGGATPDATTYLDGSMKPTADGSIASDTDGSSFDAGTLTDSAIPHDGTVFGYCPSHTGHSFCDDFDPTTSLTGRWITHTGIGTVIVGSLHYSSPPHSVVATSPDTDGGQDNEDDIEKAFMGAAKTIDVEAAFKIAALNAPSADFLAVELIPLDQSVYDKCYFDVNASSGGTVLEVECYQPDGGSFYNNVALSGTQPNWDRVHLGVNLNTGQVSGVIAGAPKKLSIPAGLGTAKFLVMAGVVYKDIGGSAVVRVDDVTIDTN